MQSFARSDRHALPRAAVTAAGYGCLALISVVAGPAVDAESRLVISVAVGFAAVGLLEFARAWRTLSRRRRMADTLLLTGVRVHPASDLLVWREAEVCARRSRRVLARSLRRIVSECQRPRFRSGAPLDLRNVRSQVELLAALADRVGALERPVTARGMVLVEELLTNAHGSPLYLGTSARDVAAAIEGCLVALDEIPFARLA
jgi:hypothetical protein